MSITADKKIYFHIDSIETEKAETIITGWVIYNTISVAISLLNCQNYVVDRIYRSDVESAFSKDFVINPECGFEIRAKNLDVHTDKIIFCVNTIKMAIDVEETKAAKTGKLEKLIHNKISFLEIPLYIAQKAFHPQNFIKGILHIKNDGLMATYNLISRRSKSLGVNYALWLKNHSAGMVELERQKEFVFKFQPLISVIVPVYNTPPKFLKEMIASVQKQSYSKWELCLADGSNNDVAYKIIEDYANKDSRIKYEKLIQNDGISGNTNAALAMAKGDYVALLDHDDILLPEALFEVVKAINASNIRPGLIYTDEDKTNSDATKVFDPAFKPDFSPYTLRNDNYICHFTVIDKELLDNNNIKFSNEYNGAQDYDIILRVSEKARSVVHVPKILYHWRAHRGSTASTNKEAKPYTHEAGKKAISDHVKRLGIDALVTDGSNGELPNVYRVKYAIKGKPKVSIIIPNHNNKKYLERCINSIMRLTSYDNYEIIIIENNSEEQALFTYYDQIKKNKNITVLEWQHTFNYSAINNFAANHCNGDYLLFMNNDIEIITKDWLTELLGICTQNDVGAVGAKLYYENNTIQHAGIIVGICGVAGHCFKGNSKRDYGYALRLTTIQNISAVTGALMLTKKDLFMKVNGFDEKLAVAFNDVDYCLKLRKINSFIIFDPYVEAYHYESLTRGSDANSSRRKDFAQECKYFEDKWGKNYLDPYYNINLSRNSLYFD